MSANNDLPRDFKNSTTGQPERSSQRKEAKNRESPLKEDQRQYNFTKNKEEIVDEYYAAYLSDSKSNSKGLKRDQPPPINDQDVITKPGLTKVLTSTDSELFSSSSKPKNEDKSKKNSRISPEIELQKSKSLQKENLIGTTASLKMENTPQYRYGQSESERGDSRDVCQMHRRTGGSLELHHLHILIDKGDVCDCPDHRVSYSLCRKSKRNSSPLQEVKEREDIEEESVQGSQNKNSNTLDIERPSQGNPLDIERSGTQ